MKHEMDIGIFMGVGFSRSSQQLNFEVWDSGFGSLGG